MQVKLSKASVCGIALVLFAVLFSIPTTVKAAGVPTTISVANAETVVAGQEITFTVTVTNPEFGGVTSGSQRIQWTNPLTKKTNDVANRTMIPLVSVVNGVYTFKYRPSLSEVGRTEVFSVTVPISNARIPKTISGWGYFTVVAA